MAIEIVVLGYAVFIDGFPRMKVEIAMDWLENYAHFSKELPSLSYLIFISYIKDGFIWPKGEDFLNLVSRYKDLRRFNSHPDWQENFKKLSMQEYNFRLFKKIEFSNKICWYIYKNKNIDDK